MTTVVTRQQSACISRNPTIPPASLQEISDQRCFSEVRDDDEAPNNGETLKDSQPSRKGKERADPPGGEPSNIPSDTNDPRNFGSDPGDDNPDSLDDGDNDPDHVLSSTPTTHAPDALTQLLNVINRPANTKSKAKVRKPEVYDGTDQAKLRTFFLQCYINFRDRPSAFQTGSAKIQYAISYLYGSALQYFEPAILGEVTPEPVWLRDWDAFKDELQMNFGPYDNAAQVEIELEKIMMKEHHKVAWYFIAFSRASTRTQWNDAALRHFAYKDLAKHIKDDLMHFSRYRSLAELHNFALEIDS
jgi:Retrotransposon gag protein